MSRQKTYFFTFIHLYSPLLRGLGAGLKRAGVGPGDDANRRVRADEDLTNFMGNAVGCMGVAVGPGSQIISNSP
jgi:hypothetical protein